MPPKDTKYAPLLPVARSDAPDTESSEESSDESADEGFDESDSIDGDIKGSGGCCKCSCKRLKKPWNCLRSFFNGYIPNNLYTIDFKLLFILTATYVHLTGNSI